jgi:thiol-disulfide isomerase/thioredoxin
VVFSQSQSALAVDAVVVDSPAERAGLRAGDAVVSLNGQTFAQSRDAVSAIQRLSAGTALPIVVSRAGQRISLSATLATAPELGDLPQNPAPPLRAVVAANGGSADLLALRGRVVVVDFFASWCGPCRLTMPWLNQLQNRLANQGLSVIGITDETAREAQQIALSLHVQYTLATDATGPMRWGVRSLPTLVVIDRAGIVREYYNGSDSQQNRALESLVRRLLAEPAPAAPTAPATAVPATPPTTTTATNPARAAPAPTNVPRTP